MLLPELVTRIELENNDVQGLHFWNCYINSDEIKDIYSCKAIEKVSQIIDVLPKKLYTCCVE